MKRLLVVVDYQNDFVNGSLGFDGAEKLEDPILKKIEAYRAAGDEVAFTFDRHASDYLDTQEGKNLPIPHCIEGEAGMELFGGLADTVRSSDHVFMKPTFGSADLFTHLMNMQHAADEMGMQPYQSIELVGLVSNICVISNAVIAKTACPNVPVIVDAECTASVDTVLHEKCLDVMEGLQIQVTNRT